MSMVDLSKLPPPDVVEALDYEDILAERKARMKALFAEVGIMADWDDSRESDPIVKMLEENAYRELLLRGRVNDACRAVLLASAKRANLDQIGALYDVKRMVVTPEDTSVIPPKAAVMEDDDRYRRRIQLSFEGFSTAGPVGAYIFHTLSADIRVKDCSVTRPWPGTVLVTVLSTEGDGTAAVELLDIVLAALNDEKVRPLNDTVMVASAEIVAYAIAATLEIEPGPDAETVRAAALAQAQAYADSVHVVGGVAAYSGIDGALHRPGVRRALRTTPAGDVVATTLQAPYCTGIAVEVSRG